ncbi:hypothetical protein CALCODRAFT_207243 [Calocera cornea HHB12733]|uniref:Uncharacterized protein n=1 Tax=Calocera cornea HHB12733 TaxID=1353952 RepID=A0A165K283_9BASI|nr:hypothetical protein CALCODRAFT_207243 [Calocera cornea HHB12733]
MEEIIEKAVVVLAPSFNGSQDYTLYIDTLHLSGWERIGPLPFLGGKTVRFLGQMLFDEDVERFRNPKVTLHRAQTTTETDPVFKITFEKDNIPLGMMLADHVQFDGPTVNLNLLDLKSCEMLCYKARDNHLEHKFTRPAPSPSTPPQPTPSPQVRYSCRPVWSSRAN